MKSDRSEWHPTLRRVAALTLGTFLFLKALAEPGFSQETSASRLFSLMRPELQGRVCEFVKGEEKSLSFVIKTSRYKPAEYAAAIEQLGKVKDPNFICHTSNVGVQKVESDGTTYVVMLVKNHPINADLRSTNNAAEGDAQGSSLCGRAATVFESLRNGTAPARSVGAREDLQGDWYLECGNYVKETYNLLSEKLKTAAKGKIEDVWINGSRVYMSVKQPQVEQPPLPEERGPSEVWWGQISKETIQRRVDELINAHELDGKGTEIYACPPARLFVVLDEGKVSIMTYAIFGAPPAEYQTPIAQLRVCSPEIGKPYIVPNSYYYEYAPLIVGYGLSAEGVRVNDTFKVTKIVVGKKFITEFAPKLKGKKGAKFGYDESGDIVSIHVDPRRFNELRSIVGRAGFNVTLDENCIVSNMNADYESPYNLPGFWKIRVKFYDQSGRLIPGAYLIHVAGTIRDKEWPFITKSIENSAVEGILRRPLEQQYSHGCVRTADQIPYLLNLSNSRSNGDWTPYKNDRSVVVSISNPENLLFRLKNGSGTAKLRKLNAGWVGWAFFKEDGFPIKEGAVDSEVEVDGKKYRLVWIGIPPEESIIYQNILKAEGNRGVTDYVPYLLTDTPDGKTIFTLFKDEYNVYVKQYYADYIRKTLKDANKYLTDEQINSLIDEANEKGIARIVLS